MQASRNDTGFAPDAPAIPQGTAHGHGDKGDRWTMSRRAGILLATLSVLLTLVSAFFGIRFLLNVRFLGDYDEGTYNASIPHTLTYLNFPDPYLPYHNFGCASFMLGNYDYAAGAFYEALQNDPPHDEPFPSRECQIRINLALSLTRPLDVEHWDGEAERQQLIQTLTQAREYLTEDGCANPAKDVFDGHSEDAEQLKRDIDKALERLQDSDGGGGDNSDDDQRDQDDKQDDQRDDSGGQGGQQNEERLKEKLNNRKSTAAQSRAEEQREWEGLGGSSSPSGPGDTDGNPAGGSKRKTW